MYSSILDKNELFLLKKISFLGKFGFYLAGGTGLALQLGHRTSVDLDFYTQKLFNIEDVACLFGSEDPKIKITGMTEGTIFGRFKNTELSFFHYPYKLLNSFISFEQVLVASTQDIAAMKIAAIVQRGVKRDFIDIYYLLKKYRLRKLISWTLKKYPSYQQILLLKALIYFDDAEEMKEKRAIKILDKKFSWEKAKKKIFEEVKKYQLGMINS